MTKRLYLDLSLWDLSILCIHFIYVKKQIFQRLLFLRDSINLDPVILLVRNGNVAEKSFVYFFWQNLLLQISKRSGVQV